MKTPVFLRGVTNLSQNGDSFQPISRFDSSSHSDHEGVAAQDTALLEDDFVWVAVDLTFTAALVSCRTADGQSYRVYILLVLQN